MDKLTLAERVRKYRGENRLTQQQFADMAGVKRLVVIRAEKGGKLRAENEVKILNAIETKN